VNNGENTATFNGHEQDVLCIDVAQDKNSFITGSIDKQSLLWDIRTEKPELSFSGKSDINTIKYFPSQKAFATGDEDGNLILFDIRGDRELMRFTHETKVNSLAISHSGKYIFSGAGENLFVWNTIESNISSTFENEDVVSSVGINPTGEAVVISCWNGNLKFYA